MSQRTFSIIKPDAVRKGYTAAILAEIEKAGFQILSIKKQSISKPQAEGFYAVHSARPFFDSLTTFMSSGPHRSAGTGKGKCDCRSAQADGRHQSRERGRWNDSQEVRRIHRRERDSWLRRTGNGCIRDRLLVRRIRTGLRPESEVVVGCFYRPKHNEGLAFFPVILRAAEDMLFERETQTQDTSSPSIATD